MNRLAFFVNTLTSANLFLAIATVTLVALFVAALADCRPIAELDNVNDIATALRALNKVTHSIDSLSIDGLADALD